MELCPSRTWNQVSTLHDLDFIKPRFTGWFRSHVTRKGENDDDKPDGIFVKKIDTKVHLADLFTKPLSKDLFEPLRKLLIGW